MFRELAVSYLSRFDLAHVDPSETGFDALGKGVEEGKAPDTPNSAAKYLSKGLTRSRTDKLGVISGGTQTGGGSGVTTGGSTQQAAGNNVTSFHTAGATALKSNAALDRLEWQNLEERMRSLVGEAKPDAKPQAKAAISERRAEAKARGYEGEACGECQNFTLVRNGTCMKCDTCGSTTGCS